MRRMDRPRVAMSDSSPWLSMMYIAHLNALDSGRSVGQPIPHSGYHPSPARHAGTGLHGTKASVLGIPHKHLLGEWI